LLFHVTLLTDYLLLAQVLSPDVDTVALQRLRHTVDQMRDSIRSYEHQLNSKSNEVDSVS